MSGDRCRPVELPTGETVLVLGDGEFSDEERAALGVLMDAARARFAAEHADDPLVARRVADAVTARLAARSLSWWEAHREIGVPLSAGSRLMQGGATLTVRELDVLARWAGLELVAREVAENG